ncbi:MAG TPA: ferric reductase-like transmembrane domain-containing protein, partial [Coleofasciculaceae cyanobacterium]
IAHTVHMAEHSWGWNLDAISFMLPQQQWAIVLGGGAVVLMAPAAFTSFDWAQRRLGKLWRSLHLLSIPALILAVLHTMLIGSHYLGAMQLTGSNRILTGLLGAIAIGVLLIRCRWIWSLLSLEKYYVSPNQSKSSPVQ